jgi:hypothetical protein
MGLRTQVVEVNDAAGPGIEAAGDRLEEPPLEGRELDPAIFEDFGLITSTFAESTWFQG